MAEGTVTDDATASSVLSPSPELMITVSASAPAYLQEAVANYRNVAAVGSLDQAVITQGTGTYATAGPTASVSAGELVVANLARVGGIKNCRRRSFLAAS